MGTALSMQSTNTLCRWDVDSADVLLMIDLLRRISRVVLNEHYSCLHVTQHIGGTNSPGTVGVLGIALDTLALI